ncbi:MAG: Hint domain-containing protein [Pseudomonadota bacterium]
MATNVGGRMVPDSEAGTQAAKEAARIRSSGGGGGGGGGSCFPGDALVLTQTGWVPIKDIREKQLVLSILADGSARSSRVLKKKAYGKRAITDVVDQKGAHLFRATGSHAVLTQKGWKKVGQLNAGDILFSNDGGEGFRRSIVGDTSHSNEIEEVFNLVVENNFTFVVKGCVAHSFTHFRALRSFGWTIRSQLQNLDFVGSRNWNGAKANT